MLRIRRKLRKRFIDEHGPNIRQLYPNKLEVDAQPPTKKTSSFFCG